MKALISYWHYRDKDMEEVARKYHATDLFADSGAFSARHSGADVTVEAYASWLERWGHLLNGYANLDVIGDPGATWENQHGWRPSASPRSPSSTGGSRGSTTSAT